MQTVDSVGAICAPCCRTLRILSLAVIMRSKWKRSCTSACRRWFSKRRWRTWMARVRMGKKVCSLTSSSTTRIFASAMVLGPQGLLYELGKGGRADSPLAHYLRQPVPDVDLLVRG